LIRRRSWMSKLQSSPSSQGAIVPTDPFSDAYCHPYFCRTNRDLCVFVPREKKRPPKNKESRNTKHYSRAHCRAVCSDEVRLLMNSPGLSPISKDLEASESVPSGSAKDDVFNLRHLVPISEEQKYALVDRTLCQDNGRLSMQQRMNQKPMQQQWQKRLKPCHFPQGRPHQVPVNHKSSNTEWMRDHEANLWKFVNGLVVDSSELFNSKNGIAEEASSFSTDEILSEIASTFNTGTTEPLSVSISKGSSTESCSTADAMFYGT
jgi:hypothetical protein